MIGSLTRHLYAGLVGVLLAIAAGVVAAAPSEQDATQDGRGIARTLLGDTPSQLWPRLGEELRALLGNAGTLDQMGAQLRAGFGPETELLSEQVTLGGGGYEYRRVARHALNPTPLAVHVFVSAEGIVEGLQVRPDAAAGAVAPDLPEARAGRFPDSDWIQARLDGLTAAGGPYPGVIVAVLDENGRRFIASGDAGDGAPPDSGTVFAAGSITKGLTGLLLAQMIDAGEVRADQPIGPLFPDPSILSPTLAAITLEALATHRSGLPRLSAGPAMAARMASDDPYAGSTPEEIYADVAAVSDQALSARRGQFVYSNIGIALLGQLLGQAAGSDYASLLAQRILGPLELGPATLEAGQVAGRAALGHSGATPVRAWRLDAYAPAGAWRASADALLGLGERLLAAEPAWVGEALRVRASEGGPDVGLAWMHGRAGDRAIIWHNGGTAGFSSFLAIVPDENLALVVLANGAGGVDTLAMELLGARP